ncbi:MAG: (Na+)-NQR maturation NqrM [Desulfuromonadaceae bacterium]
MTLTLAVLLLFLLAFVCMALGVIMGRKGLRGGCGSVPAKGDCNKSECHCSGSRAAGAAGKPTETS